MANRLNLYEIEESIKSVLENSEDLSAQGTAVIIEPYQRDLLFPQISLVRADVPFEIITLNRTFRVSLFFELEYSVFNMNSVQEAYKELDTITDSMLRVIVDTRKWGRNYIISSEPTSIQHHIKRETGGIKVSARMQLKILLQYA